MKIAVNNCYGGFSVSNEAAIELRKLGVKVTLQGEKFDDGSVADNKYGVHLYNENFGIKDSNWCAFRCDKRLIEVIEKLGNKKASGALAQIRIAVIPNDVEWEIDDYDGIESIHEKHRSW